jgi:hypothetical protein
MRQHVYSVIYSVAPINSSLLTITLCYSVGTTLVCNDTKYIVVSCRYDRVRLYLLMLSSLYSSVFWSSGKHPAIHCTRQEASRLCNILYILMRALVYNFVLPLRAVQVLEQWRANRGPPNQWLRPGKLSNTVIYARLSEWRAFFLNYLVNIAHTVELFEWCMRFKPILHGTILCLQFHIWQWEWEEHIVSNYSVTYLRVDFIFVFRVAWLFQAAWLRHLVVGRGVPVCVHLISAAVQLR